MREFSRLLVTMGLALAIGGCSTNKQLVATGGSRADGTVNLSYEHGPYEKPQLNLAQGLETARDRCRAWGYSDAEPFGGETRQCNMPGGYGGCYKWFVTLTFQCLGKAPA